MSPTSFNRDNHPRTGSYSDVANNNNNNNGNNSDNENDKRSKGVIPMETVNEERSDSEKP